MKIQKIKFFLFLKSFEIDTFFIFVVKENLRTEKERNVIKKFEYLW